MSTTKPDSSSESFTEQTQVTLTRHAPSHPADKHSEIQSEPQSQSDPILEPILDELLVIEPMGITKAKNRVEPLKILTFMREYAVYLRKLVYLAAVNQSLAVRKPPLKMIEVTDTDQGLKFHSALNKLG